MSSKHLNEVRCVKERVRFHLLLKSNVIGVAVGLKRERGRLGSEPCILVLVNPKLPPEKISSADLVPDRIEGVRTDVWRFGPRTMSGTSHATNRTQRFRPVPGGVSAAHYALKGAGTMGHWYRDVSTGEPVMFSNWHVFTNFGTGRQGDDIIQPSWADGGRRPDDTVGYLERWVEVKFLGPTVGESKSNLKLLMGRNKHPEYVNTVDAAIARPTSDEIVDPQILGVDHMSKHVREPTLGHKTIMSGRSGIIEGIVVATDLDVFVDYQGRIALFEDSAMSLYSSVNFIGLTNKVTNICRLLDVKPLTE